MKQFKYFIKFYFLFFGFILFFSCNKENEAYSLSVKSENNNRSRAQLLSHRIKVNDRKSAVISYTFEDGKYKIEGMNFVESLTSDKYGVLQFGMENEGTVKIGILSEGENDLIDILFRYGDQPQYGCECNSLQYLADDCVKRTYGGTAHYCDGNFCDACSLIMSFKLANENVVLKNKSVIIYNE